MRSRSIDLPRYTVQVKRLHPDAVIPSCGSDWAAGFDLHALLEDGNPLILRPMAPAVLVRTGIAVQIGIGYVGLVFPRSGRGHKEGLVLGNATGVIDGDYTGELFVSLVNRTSNNMITVNPYDRVAQLVVMQIPHILLSVVQEFAVATERGDGGLGSTGN